MRNWVYYMQEGLRNMFKKKKTDDSVFDYSYTEKEFKEPISENQIAFGHDMASEEVDGMYFDDEVKEWEEAVGYKEKDCGCGDCGCKN